MTDSPELASRRIAVIGAGIAGLSCAVHLQAAGLHPQVFDKSRGLGGRLSTRRGDTWQCDHGAQYFTARHPAFRVVVEAWVAAGMAAVWQPRLAVLGDASSHRPDPTLARYVGTPRMTAPAHALSQGLTLRTQSTISELRRTAQGWQLRSAETGWLDELFDAVVLALPAPQAGTLLAGHSAALSSVVGSVRMRACWAVMLRFDESVNLSFDAAFVNSGPLRWIARDNSKPARGGTETWLLHATTDWSDAHVEADPDTVTAALEQEFVRLGGTTATARAAHRWRYAEADAALAIGHAWEPVIQVGVCGDWLQGGKIEGAWLSGLALAQAITRPDTP